MAKIRTAKQKAALRKAQLASARKRRKGKKKKSTGYKHGRVYDFGSYGTFKYNGKKKQFESTTLYRRMR